MDVECSLGRVGVFVAALRGGYDGGWVWRWTQGSRHAHPQIKIREKNPHLIRRSWGLNPGPSECKIARYALGHSPGILVFLL